MYKFFSNVGPWGQLLSLLLMALILFIISLGFYVIPMTLGSAPGFYIQQNASQIVTFAGAALCFALLFGSRDGNPDVLHLRSVPHMPRLVLAAVAIFLLFIGVTDWLTAVNDRFHLPSSMSAIEKLLRETGEMSQSLLEQYLLRDGVGPLMLNLFTMALVPAICEELFFRGAMQGILCRCFRNTHVGIVVTAAIFSLMHGEVFAFLPRFFMGLLLGYLFLYGGSLWINAAAHFANNAVLVVLYFLCARGVVDLQHVDSLDLPWYVTLLGAAVAAALFCVAFRRRSDGASPATDIRNE